MGATGKTELAEEHVLVHLLVLAASQTDEVVETVTAGVELVADVDTARFGVGVEV
jgi:hypothetical protein